MPAIILALMLSSATCANPIKHWWKNFCEKNIVADEPKFIIPIMETSKLIKTYREVGARVYWGRTELKPLLQSLGDELRAMPENEDAKLALRDYSGLE